MQPILRRSGRSTSPQPGDVASAPMRAWLDDDRRSGIALVLGMAALMWVVEIVDSLDSHRLDGWGIRPHHADRLIGIVTAPFLHVSFSHLEGNTLPFIAMGVIVALGGLARVAGVTAIVVVL